ncbi:MAG: hypothetical protein IJ906_11510 [Oscillospiraceae bacterium]|nr:hypothetical protein [Oscillospiraceae bacterium]
MKRKILPVLLLCTAMLTPTLNAEALEEGAPIALSIRPMNGTTAGADGAVHVSAEEAAAGTKMHIGVFIESDNAEMNRIGVRIQSSDPALTFVPESIITGKDEISETPVTYIIGEDNLTFSTKFRPYCLGVVNDGGFYLPDCYFFTKNLISETDLYMYWLYGIGNSKAFLGGASDTLSFFEFDAALAPGTKPGTYSLELIADDAEEDPEGKHLTSIVWDAGTRAKPDYHRVTPALKNLTITVDAAKASEKGDVNRSGEINAKDAAAVLQYAAKVGTGGTELTQADHDQYKQLGDVNGDGMVNAKDANGILIYAAAIGTNTPITWEKIFGEK